MCSTFKLALVAACLRESDQGRLDLAQILTYSEADLLPWAPVTGRNLGSRGMSIGALAQAAQPVALGSRRGGGQCRYAERYLSSLYTRRAGQKTALGAART